jgi:hypothetical protein
MLILHLRDPCCVVKLLGGKGILVWPVGSNGDSGLMWFAGKACLQRYVEIVGEYGRRFTTPLFNTGEATV